MTILVTGGCGFIGSNFILDWLGTSGEAVVNVDRVTYAGNPSNLASLANDFRYHFQRADIGDTDTVLHLLKDRRVRAIVNFAAESHVDRSIHEPEAFIQTNVVGTFRLLEAVKSYWPDLGPEAKAGFRFVHVSTDEVYGSLERDDPAFTETTPYQPNSPYAASKASSDHLARAYHETYGLPVITTNCSNNYGPLHFPEKLIPLVISNALRGKPLPIYGDGKQVRDWLYVKDHCSALRKVLERGVPGDSYNIGGNSEKENIEVVRTICFILDGERPRKDSQSYSTQITFVKDRMGHDRRYAVNATKIRQELGWQPSVTFETGIRRTIRWYLDNPDWVEAIISGSYYRDWVKNQYN